MNIQLQKWLVMFWVMTASISCRVAFVGAYDQVTDQSIQKIQTDVSILFIKMEKKINEGSYTMNSYDSLRNDFINIEGEVKSLQIRCSSLPKYEKVQDELTSVSLSLNDLEAIAKTQMQNTIILKPAESAFEIDFKAMITFQNSLKTQK